MQIIATSAMKMASISISSALFARPCLLRSLDFLFDLGMLQSRCRRARRASSRQAEQFAMMKRIAPIGITDWVSCIGTQVRLTSECPPARSSTSDAGPGHQDEEADDENSATITADIRDRGGAASSAVSKPMWRASARPARRRNR
jgi:hypothetical protein